MKLKGAKQQTVFLTAINAIVRVMGLAMRVCLSRIAGSEAMGVIELAQSVHMVAIAPLTSGLPVAISRLTARADNQNQVQPFSAGVYLVKRVSLFLIPLLWLASPFLAKSLGDIRVLPSLWFTAPCVLILGYSAASNGYCYGVEKSHLPAISELIEQIVRFGLTLVFLRLLRYLTLPWLCAIPVAATMIAEIVGLLFVFSKLPVGQLPHPSSAWTRSVARLSIPSTLTRLIQTLLRSLTAILIPNRLHASGMSIAEATSQLGMLNGMVSPILMLPGILTSALSMVMIPHMAKAEEKPSELGRLLKMCLRISIPLSAFFSFAVYGLAPFIANGIYRHAELTALFKRCALQILLFPVNHMILSTLSALGQQKRALYVSCFSAAVSLVLTWTLAADPKLKINGIICAQYLSQIGSILLGSFMLLRWRMEQLSTRGDKCV